MGREEKEGNTSPQVYQEATILTLAKAHEYVGRYTSRIVLKKIIKGPFKDVMKALQNIASCFETIIEFNNNHNRYSKLICIFILS